VSIINDLSDKSYYFLTENEAGLARTQGRVLADGTDLCKPRLGAGWGGLSVLQRTTAWQ